MANHPNIVQLFEPFDVPNAATSKLQTHAYSWRNKPFESLQKQTIHGPKSRRVCFLNVLLRVPIFQTQMSACRVHNVEMAALLEKDNKNKIAASSRPLLCYSAVSSPPPPHIPISRHFTTIFSLSQISVLSLSSFLSLSHAHGVFKI